MDGANGKQSEEPENRTDEIEGVSNRRRKATLAAEKHLLTFLILSDF
jgi:hypothetical protein